jgi:DNA-binding transcriptional MerR regulator
MEEKSIYNIGAIARITGISISTLHAWERRYGFPRAERTTGGHRLYSDKDVFLLRLVKERLKQGLTARQAVVAVQKMEAEGTLAFGFSTETLRTSLPPQTATGSRPAAPLALREQLTASLLRHDLESADQVMGEMLAFYPPEELTLNVIGPVMSEIGEGWQQGRVSVVTEHLATNYLRHRLLMWMVTGPRPRALNPILLACAPQELHEGSLLMLGVLLRRQGWPVAYLGQTVPFHDLATFIKETSPSVIVLVAMQQKTARSLATWPRWLHQTGGKPLVTFGGRAFVLAPELQKTVPGIYLGSTIQDGANELMRLLQQNPIPSP